MDFYELALIAGVVFITGISKSAFAGALGIFSVPLLTVKLPVADAIALMLPILIVADCLTLKSFWRKWDKSILASLIPGAILGILTANLTIHLISSDLLALILGLLCIVYAIKAILFTRLTVNSNPGLKHGVIFSGISGFSSTLIHAGAPPIMVYLKALELSPMKFVATASAFYALMNLIKLASFSLSGILLPVLVLKAAYFIPVALLGHWAGLKIYKKMDTKRYSQSINYLLLATGTWLLVKSLIIY